MNQEQVKSESAIRDVVIEYCVVCNYRAIAAVTAKQVEMEFGVKPTFVQSKVNGALEVKVDGELIFSKTKSGRFPQQGEVVQILKKRMKGEA
ncbi:MAG: Rdx family protein [Alphaproteobacteria bacterium]|uniref:Rdx family protein n=1 Tax=Candidatus Nitrobium versatile TaxID=2884831 RepID=A0A953J9G6_9BACT|nr:Rdx family protein [Candidatus Nitrobium versatile]